MTRTAMDYLEHAIALIAARPDRSRFVGPASESKIDSAEAYLGLKFPNSYREFLKQLGSGSIAGCEFVGMFPEMEGASQVESWPELLFTHKVERLSGAHQSWLVISEDGAGGLYVVPTLSKMTSEGEPPVLHWWRGAIETDVEEISPSFGHYFFDIVVNELANEQ